MTLPEGFLYDHELGFYKKRIQKMDSSSGKMIEAEILYDPYSGAVEKNVISPERADTLDVTDTAESKKIEMPDFKKISKSIKIQPPERLKKVMNGGQKLFEHGDGLKESKGDKKAINVWIPSGIIILGCLLFLLVFGHNELFSSNDVPRKQTGVPVSENVTPAPSEKELATVQPVASEQSEAEKNAEAEEPYLCIYAADAHIAMITIDGISFEKSFPAVDSSFTGNAALYSWNVEFGTYKLIFGWYQNNDRKGEDIGFEDMMAMLWQVQKGEDVPIYEVECTVDQKNGHLEFIVELPEDSEFNFLNENSSYLYHHNYGNHYTDSIQYEKVNAEADGNLKQNIKDRWKSFTEASLKKAEEAEQEEVKQKENYADQKDGYDPEEYEKIFATYRGNFICTEEYENGLASYFYLDGAETAYFILNTGSSLATITGGVFWDYEKKQLMFMVKDMDKTDFAGSEEYNIRFQPAGDELELAYPDQYGVHKAGTRFRPE